MSGLLLTREQASCFIIHKYPSHVTYNTQCNGLYILFVKEHTEEEQKWIGIRIKEIAEARVAINLRNDLQAHL